MIGETINLKERFFQLITLYYILKNIFTLKRRMAFVLLKVAQVIAKIKSFYFSNFIFLIHVKLRVVILMKRIFYLEKKNNK